MRAAKTGLGKSTRNAVTKNAFTRKVRRIKRSQKVRMWSGGSSLRRRRNTATPSQTRGRPGKRSAPETTASQTGPFWYTARDEAAQTPAIGIAMTAAVKSPLNNNTATWTAVRKRDTA
ncbi:MAG: hypothetical protein DRJ42_27985 [Deltaproteobacteria bacterium]|nr:MAG: hypothetical protein DRJ42_27985 [Deltaproteobacteria bacterium]